ncbi:MAG: sulfatase-like hydrolase/transferase [Coraliomargarita sp.]
MPQTLRNTLILAAVALLLASTAQAQITLDWRNKVSGTDANPWSIEIQNTAGTPSYGTVNGGDSPGLTGTFSDVDVVSFTLTLEGRDTNFIPTDFESGTPAAISSNNSGPKIESDEGILFTLDLSNLGVDEGLEISAFTSNDNDSLTIYHNEKRISNAALFSGLIVIDGDQIAFVAESSAARLQTITLDIVPYTPVAPVDPIQTLSARIAESITGSAPVSHWADQSGNFNDALPEIGNVNYPSESPLSSGIAGIDFGSDRNSIELFSTSESDTWLNQSSDPSGFAVFVAFKCEDIVTGVFNDLLGNSTDGTTGLQLGYTADGQIQVILDGTLLAAPLADAVEAGDTISVSVNYDAATGTLSLWNSKTGDSVETTVSAADFSTNQPVTAGSINTPSQYINGVIGAIQVFNQSLDQELFASKRIAFTSDWILRPNIIMFFVDDMPWYDTPVAMDDRMPNSYRAALRRLKIDGEPYEWNIGRLAEEGMTFINGYSSAPQCTPSRASLQTGQSTARNRVGVNGANWGQYKNPDTNKFPVIENGIDFPLKAPMIPQILAPFGYQCAHYGKWHIEPEPEVSGYASTDGPTNNNPGTPEDPNNPKRIPELANKAINFITTQHNAKQPFYVQLSHYAVHRQFQSLDSSQALFLNDEAVNGGTGIATYLGMIYDLDQALGQLMTHLESLGIDDNTYIIFTADNGDRANISLDEMKEPFYGDKWMLWQLGIRVPLIISGPGVVKGSRTPFNAVTYDFLPTYFEWAGGDPNTLSEIDGISLKGLLEGESQSDEVVNRSLYFHYPHYRNSMPMSAVVKGKWKLLRAWDAEIRIDQYQINDRDMLFDLSIDPGEFHNLNNTSAEFTAKTDELAADLEAYLTEVDAWIPKDNEDAYLDDNGATFEASKDRAHDDFPLFEGTRPTNLSAINLKDLDKSPMEHWFDNWGMDIGDASNDFEPDGLTNLMEYILGTNPTVVDSADQVDLPLMVANGEDLQFQFSSRFNPGEVSVTAQYKETLADEWEDIDSEFNYSGALIDRQSVTAPSTDSGFFRLQVTTP